MSKIDCDWIFGFGMMVAGLIGVGYGLGVHCKMKKLCEKIFAGNKAHYAHFDFDDNNEKHTIIMTFGAGSITNFSYIIADYLKERGK